MARERSIAEQTEHPLHSAGWRHFLFGLAFRLYKSLVSPMIHAIAPSRCLYLPTCSEYAYTAISRFGIVHGSWLAMGRFARCHPWGKGGLDPVPDLLQTAKFRSTETASSVSGHKGADHLS